MDFVAVRAHPDLLTYVDSLQRKNATALSFYPRVTFERELSAGRILLGLLGGEPCGYVWHGAFGGIVSCHQVCIQYDARRRLYGEGLIRVLEADADGSEAIQLRCAFDIDANDFWRALGYRCIAQQQGGGRRSRQINVWRKDLVPFLIPAAEIAPAVGRMSMVAWSANRDIPAPSRFSRGAAARRYRAAIAAAGR
jgi:hypothetical protein